ncbi:antitoxin HicB [Blautia obeum]|jgi:predicted HicB family RNase H-like nuclease|uniref:Antitoxin HicB n=1 Tax=Blautia obeum TaxID=40520 RepID=A0A414S884_9FIRM|nr:antitoxin HicB [Blautia obeum]NSC72020.1 antitoxin HicB [Blautia obeum]RHB49478.1 antitoxin HicB [Blautia obeum]RHG14419.1 antitoxin HicB [Blautia obeum]
MNKQLQYKGYIGDVNYDPEGKYYYGQIQNISAAVGYDGNNLLELEEDFHTAVDDYIILISQL